MIWLKKEFVVVALSLVVSVLAQVASWGAWLIWWGDEGKMPDPILFAVRAAGISLISGVVAFVVGTVINTVATVVPEY